jgi:hypothetical protein
MKRHRIALISAAALAALTISCAPHARVGVYADVPGPPAFAFETEPYLVPLPGTYAYGVPDYDVDLYYADGYYWRPWQGRWYRSTYYDRGWVSYSGIPFFYSSVPRGWRDDYRSSRWRGRSWEYARVPRHEVERNWSSWKRERRWDEDQRRYTGDRRWHDDRRHGDTRQGAVQRDYDRREAERRAESRPDYDRREPDRRAADGRVYETREVDRRVYDGRQPVERREVEQRNVEVERRPVERREIEQRNVEIERRPVQRREVEQRNVEIERREVERREAAPVRRGPEPRPVVQERRTIETQQVERNGRGPVATPRGRGPSMKDENRDGIDDREQRPR